MTSSRRKLGDFASGRKSFRRAAYCIKKDTYQWPRQTNSPPQTVGPSRSILRSSPMNDGRALACRQRPALEEFPAGIRTRRNASRPHNDAAAFRPDGGSIELAGIVVEPTDDLLRLQQKLIEAVAPLAVATATSARCSRRRPSRTSIPE